MCRSGLNEVVQIGGVSYIVPMEVSDEIDRHRDALRSKDKLLWELAALKDRSVTLNDVWIIVNKAERELKGAR